MARSTGKVYLTVGIPRRSPLYVRLVRDAEQAGVPLSQLIIVRMLDWYALSARDVAETQERQVTAFGSSQPQAKVERQGLDQQMRDNAVQALSSWSG